MMDCHGVSTPESEYDTTTSKPIEQDMPYREIVGAVQYLVSGTRPDLAHATRVLGQFNACYEWSHFQKAKRVLRYLKHTIDYGLLLRCTDHDKAILEVFTDADYADDRKSVSGYVTQVDGSSISLDYVKPPKLWCDNLATVYLSEKPGKHSKFKHDTDV
ncbi:hypothetical protein ATCC90586_006158 [Pythium insidiosum]|nr:hypothetical protein ATCC90586_006158 [Pythium insidiosum]